MGNYIWQAEHVMTYADSAEKCMTSCTYPKPQNGQWLVASSARHKLLKGSNNSISSCFWTNLLQSQSSRTPLQHSDVRVLRSSLRSLRHYIQVHRSHEKFHTDRASVSCLLHSFSLAFPCTMSQLACRGRAGCRVFFALACGSLCCFNPGYTLNYVYLFAHR